MEEQRRKDLAKNKVGGERGPYCEFFEESTGFEKYYKAQNIVPEAEWDCLLGALKQDLPVAFRISSFNQEEAAALLDIVEEQFFKDFINPDDSEEQGKKPICLPWYPKRLGWQVPISQENMKASDTYFKLHNFLMSGTDSGNISVQEVASMIPPLVLDVQPHHKVLDMCAAPGAKTSQLVEMMHSQNELPRGVVISNDAVLSRCYKLVYRAKRLNSPCTIITNHDARVMPNIIIENPDGTPGILKYDRILCDVPCTRDGTPRENPDIRNMWNSINGTDLHGVQMEIVKRAAEMLKVGGRLVYSTCSLNPIENEAVVHRVIDESQGALELQDVSKSLPGLVYTPGISSWVLASRELEIFNNFEEVPDMLHSQIHPNMFPPKSEDVGKFHLDRCIRIMPHHQGTGGFFVAALKKIALLPWESTKSSDASNTEESPEIENIQANKENPFDFLKADEPVWRIIRDFYGIKKELQVHCLLTRCIGGKKQNIYFVPPQIHDMIEKNRDRIKLIHAGVRVFARCNSQNHANCFRLIQKGLQSIKSFVGDRRRVSVTKSDLLMLLSNPDPGYAPETFYLDPQTQKKLKDVATGSCVLEYRSEDGLSFDLVGWRGSRSLSAYVPPSHSVHVIRLLGGDTSMFGALNLTREAAENSRRTQAKGVETQEVIAKAERQCKRTDALVGRTSSEFTQGQQDNSRAVDKLGEDITQLERNIPELNNQVCHKMGDPCDQLCGGAGCGFCGGISCEEGAFTKSNKAFSFATDAEEKIHEKEAKAEELFRGISQARQETGVAKDVAMEALTAASEAQNRSESAVQQSSDLVQRLQHFLSSDGATSKEIQNLAQQTKEKNIQLQPEQITDLAVNINTTISSLRDINTILSDTAEDLEHARNLKAEADEAKSDAEGILKAAQQFLDTLEEAETVQQDIRTTLDNTNANIAQAKLDLTQITSETEEAQQKANETVMDVNALQEKVKSLQTGFLKNEKDAQEVKAEAKSMSEEVKKAENRTQDMQNQYNRAVNTLRERTQDSGLAQARAKKLLEKASQLSLNTTDKLKQLRDAEGLYREQEKELSALSNTIQEFNDRMSTYLMDINKKSVYYRNCLN